MTFLRHSESEEQTRAIGREIAAILAGQGHPCTLALHGTLGMGKSVLARSIIQSLMDDAGMDVPSPTFTLVQSYEGGALSLPLYHFDLYRIEGADEVLDLGWDDLLAEGICLIEWPEKAGAYLPRGALHLYIDADNNNAHARRITCDGLKDETA